MKKQETSFGIDPESGRLKLGRFSVPMPRSKSGRVAVGGGLVAGGCLGFLPVLGFWMVPVGVAVLSHDLHPVRRARRRLSVWWARRRQE